MEEQIVERYLNLKPEQIIAEDNIRFGLKPSRIRELADDITAVGGVLQPVEVAELEDGTYSLTAGFYRHAAVSLLNSEGADLRVPAIVRNTDEVSRLQHQLSENLERESMSPMDIAVAVRRLLDTGVPRKEIAAIFARPVGRKGEFVPVSNAWINIMANLLDLPKTIQADIHDGIIGIEAAYVLGKVSPDKRAAVVARAKADRQAQIDAEQRDEERLSGIEAKVEEAQAKVEEATSEIEERRAERDRAKAKVEEIRAKIEAAQSEPYLKYDDKQKKEMKERLTALEADLKGAQKLHKEADNAVTKLLDASAKAQQAVEENRKRLEQALSAKKKTPANKKPLGAKAMKDAAQKEGEAVGHVALNASEVRQAVKDVIKAGKTYPRVGEIGLALQACFDGTSTPKILIETLAELTGEKPAPKAKAPVV